VVDKKEISRGKALRELEDNGKNRAGREVVKI
jgi:hypothetical protein